MALITVALPVLGCLALACPPELQDSVPTNTELQAIWAKLPGEARQEVSQWYQAEIAAARTYQSQLVAFVLHGVEHDPKDWPASSQAPPLYEASVHAPAQVIKRRFVARPSRSQKAWIKKVFRARATEPAPPAWAYDYAQGTVVALAEDRLARPGPSHIFQLALAGRVPDSDLAQAIVAAIGYVPGLVCAGGKRRGGTVSAGELGAGCGARILTSLTPLGGCRRDGQRPGGLPQKLPPTFRLQRRLPVLGAQPERQGGPTSRWPERYEHIWSKPGLPRCIRRCCARGRTQRAFRNSEGHHAGPVELDEGSREPVSKRPNKQTSQTYCPHKFGPQLHASGTRHGPSSGAQGCPGMRASSARAAASP